jgi:hypothetical protein
MARDSHNVLALTLLWSLFVDPAIADCDLSKFDQSPPAAIVSTVNNETAKFEWATDVDTSNGRSWVWHYVKNLHPNRGIGYAWPKAQLRRALGTPLEPGKTDCNRYFAAAPTALDDNAPIMYGTNGASQRAAVFAEAKTASVAPWAGTITETSYNNENVRLGIWTEPEGATSSDGDRLWVLHVERSANVSVAIASLPSLMRLDQLTSIIAQFGKQSIRTEAMPLSRITKREDKEALADLFSQDEIVSRLDQQYFVMFSGGPAKAEAIIPNSGAVRQVYLDVFFFDQKNQPFFATTVGLLLPAR